MFVPEPPLSGEREPLLRLSEYIGALEVDPDDLELLAGMRELIAQRDRERLGDEPERALELARQTHELRGEFATVARLIEIEIPLVEGDRLLAASLYKELGRLRAEYLLDSAGAKAAYESAREYKPDDAEVNDALRRLEQSESSWKKFAKRFVEEAESATDVSLKASLLLRAACLAWENRRKGKNKEVDRLFAKVLEIDPGNLRAALLYEHTLREREEWKPLAQHLLDTAEVVRDRQDRVHLWMRAARVLLRRIHDKAHAEACYERVLEADPGNAEAMAFLTERFTEGEQWDRLVGLYENALRVPQKLDVEQAILVQLGTAHANKRGSPTDAEPYFARLRKLDAAHPVMLDFYRAYLPAQGEPERLLRVLLDAQRVVGEPARRVALAVEAAELAQTTHGMGERAIEAWKSVQRLDPHNAQAARVLKELYAKSEKWNALVEVLKTQIDSTPDAQAELKVELLRELAAVYRDRLRLDGMLINAYNAILRLCPGDRDTLNALADKYRELGRWNDLINALTWDADTSSDVEHRVDVYLQVAGLWLEHFSNYNQASGPLEKVIEIDPHNQRALSLLRDIYERKRAWRPLFTVLKKARNAQSEQTARAELTLQLASLAADRLHRYEDAVALYREVAADTQHAQAGLDAIERLAEREKDWATLADVLEKQAARQTQDEERIRLLLKLGALYSDRLDDAASASDVFRRVLELDPRQGRALRSLRDGLVAQGDWDELERLYERAADFESLVDVLSSEADRADARDVKVSLSLRVARIFEEKIGEPARAQRSYERVLGVDPDNVRAANALAPIYEHEEKWSRLLAMLDIVLRSLGRDDLEQRLSLLERLRKLAQERVRDSAAAFEYALRSYELAPQDESVRQALESTAEAAQTLSRVVEAYRARAEHADTDEALALWRRIAQIANQRLGKIDLAASYFERVLEVAPNDAPALGALDAIYRGQNRAADIRRLLAHRLDHEPDPASRSQLLRELALLEEEQLSDLESATERYRAMAEIEPDSPEVWATLDRLTSALGRHEALAQVLDKRRELAADNQALRVELGARLAALMLREQNEPERALDVYAEVLELDPAHGSSTEALETMVQQREALGPRVFAVLERAYERVGRYDKLAEIIKQRLLESRDEAEVRRLRLRSAEISGGQLGDALGAYSALEAAFLEEPHDTSLWERLSEAAERAHQHRALASALSRALTRPTLSESDRVELSARIARIYDEVLSEPREAEQFHKRVLEHDPQNERAFVALKELYTTEERWEDLQQLYRKRIDETIDAQTKLDLLLQVCFLFEEILEQPDKAIEAYRAVLELAPEHGPSRRTLERLYERRERYRELAQLLHDNLDHASGYDEVDTHYRLGELYETRLAEPGLAVDHYEAVLARQPHHLRAQAALGRLLAIEGLRQRVAAILEPMYESQGAYADLVRVLEIQAADRDSPDAKVDVLLRIGGLHEARLRDPESAFAAYARAVEADPSDAGARQALARLGGTREAFRRKRAQLLELAVQKVEDVDVTVELLQELAQLCRDELGDSQSAERCYARLVELAPGRDDVVLEASRALAQIHEASGDHAGLAADLSRQAELEFDGGVREQLLSRLAELYERRLLHAAAAIDTQRKRLELDPNNLEALRALERLYDGSARYEELADVLGRLRELSNDPAERHALGRRCALVLEERLGDVARAIEAHRENLEAFGPDRETLAALGRLYETQGRYADQLEMLEAEIEFAPDASTRAALRFRTAELLREKLTEPERAISAYEMALEDDPSHAGCLAALEAIARDPESPFRREAARAAAPHYEALSRFDKLLAMLELLAQTDDPIEKLRALRRAAQVAQSGQRDTVLAMGYLGRSLQCATSDESLSDLLGDYAELAQVTGRYAQYVETLQAIAPSIFDGEQRVRVYREIASAAQDKLADASLARDSYRKALQEQPDDEQVLDALLKLDEEAGDYPALIEVIGHKAALTVDPMLRARLLEKQADVYERGLSDDEHAIAALEEVIADQPLESAYQSLERLYQRTHRYGDLALLYEQQLDRGLGSPVELRYKLAKTYRQHMNDNFAALAQLREAIAVDDNHAESIALLESIMSEHGECRALAAEVLEPGYLARMQWAKLTSALCARVDAEPELGERKRLLVRLARIYEEQLEDFDETIEIYARLFREDYRDEEVWERLTRLAKVGGQWNRLAKILGEPVHAGPVEDEIMAALARYVGSLYDERAINLVKAAECYAKALEFDRDDAAAFRALESVYRRAGNYGALCELYTRQAELSANDEARVALLHKRAHVYIADIGDKPAAIATYRELLEIAPEDRAAIEGLEQLLTEAEDYRGLAEHLRWRIDHSVGGRELLDVKYRLGELCFDKLEEEDAALELWEDVVGSDPTHVQTLAALERTVQEERHRLRVTEILEPVYRTRDQWKKLIVIQEARVLLVDDVAEVSRLLSEIGKLQEERAGDPAAAFDAYARAFARDPEDDGLRAHVDRLASALGAWNEHAAAYEAAVSASDNDATKLQLLGTIARVQDEKRGDPRAAIAAYERFLAIEPDDPSTLDALEALHTMVADWRGLIAILERKVVAALGGEDRAEVLRRIGSVYEELVGDREAAIDAYQRAVEQYDTDEVALEALDRLYGASGRAMPLFETLKRRIELAQDPPLRAELGLRLGFLADVRLHQTDEAVDAYRRVLDDDSANSTAIAHLCSLYERLGHWHELLDNLRLQISLTQDTHERVLLRCRAGQVLLERLLDGPEAIECYREALQEEPDSGEATAALMELTKSDEHRMQAAEVIEPLLREGERWNDLVTVLERKLQGHRESVDRRQELLGLASVHEHGRKDKGAAFDALARALAEEPYDPSLLDDLERLATELGAFDRFYAVLVEQAAHKSDPLQSAELLRRAGRTAERELSDDARAIEAYTQAATHDDDASETLEALDRLYARTAQYEALLDVLERRISVTTEPAERVQLLLRLGELRVRRFDDGRGAFVAYQEVLDHDPGQPHALEGMAALGERDELARDVLDVLERCYRDTGAMDKLVELYELRVRLSPTDADKARLLREAAGLWERELAQPRRALQCVRRALELDPGDVTTLDELERLASDASAWADLAGLAEGLIARHSLPPPEKRELGLRAATWYREFMNDEAGEAACLRSVLALAPEELSVHARLLELVRVGGDRAALLAELRAFAAVDDDEDRRIEHLHEAGALALELGDRATGGECFEQILQAHAQDTAALAALADLRGLQGEHAQALQLLSRWLEVEIDGQRRLVLHHAICDTLAGPLHDTDGAIAAYRKLLEEFPSDSAAFSALEALYVSAQRFEELEALLTNELANTTELERRAELQLRLARLYETGMQQPARALEQVRSLLSEVPDDAAANAEFERLLTITGSRQERAQWLDQRAQRAQAAGDGALALQLLRQLAELYDSEPAELPALEAVLLRMCELDPHDRMAIERLAALHRAQGNTAAAADYMARALPLQPAGEAIATAYALSELAVQALGDPMRAEAALRHALQLDPERAETRRRLREHLSAHAAYDKLAALLEQDAELAPTPAERAAVLRELASLRARSLGDQAGAIGALERAVELVPGEREALLSLCDLYVAAGRSAAALPVLEQIIASYSGRRAKEVAVYEHRLGHAYEGMGRLDDALRHYDNAFKIDLTSVPVLRDLGRLCLSRGDLERAHKTYRALLLQKLGEEVGITKAEVYYRLGEISATQGDKAKAKAMLERAISEAGQYPQAKQLLDRL